MSEAIEYFPTYKTYMGFKYHLRFPDEWILDEFKDTGRNCKNCVGDHHDGYGMWRGIILGYCANCANYNYLGRRGGGFLEYGVEYNKMVSNDYLGIIDLEKIGDIAENPLDTMENHLARKKAYEEEEQTEMDEEAELEREIQMYEEWERRRRIEEQDDDDDDDNWNQDDDNADCY